MGTWLDAQTYCEDHGGYLGEITDADLQEALTLFTRTLYGSGYSFWLGGNDIGTEGDWYWIHSRNSIDEDLWYTDRPTDHDYLNCMSFTNSISNFGCYGYWLDRGCLENHNVICQKPYES